MANEQETKGILIVGGNIRKYRNLQKISLREMANRLDTDHSQLNRIELGKISTSIGMIYRIAGILGIEPFKLLIDDKPERDKKKQAD